MGGNILKCDECNSTENYYCERMGETTCSACGYVMITNIFEDRTTRTITYEDSQSNMAHAYLKENDESQIGSFIGQDTLGNAKLVSRLKKTQLIFRDKKNLSVNKGLMECNMVLSPYLPNLDLKNRVHNYYKRLYFAHVFRGFPLNLRACALVVICLREIGIPITVAEIAKRNGENPHKISKCARLLARKLGKSHMLQNMPITSWLERICSDLNSSQSFVSETKQVVDYINQQVHARDIHFSKTYMASSIWIASLLRKQGYPEHTQETICAACNCTPVALRLTCVKLFQMLGVNKRKLLLLNVEQFCAGIRHGM